MLRLSLLFALIMMIIAIILKKTLTKTAKVKGLEMQLTTKNLLQKISPYEIKTGSNQKLSISKGGITLPEPLAESKLLTDHAPALLAIGFTILSKGSNMWHKRHQSMVTFDQIFLPFSIVICILGVIAKTIPPNLALTILFASLTLCCMNNFYLTWVRRLAMNLVITRVQNISLYSKREDQESMENYLQSYAYQNLIPYSLKWIA